MAGKDKKKSNKAKKDKADSNKRLNDEPEADDMDLPLVELGGEDKAADQESKENGVQQPNTKEEAGKSAESGITKKPSAAFHIAVNDGKEEEVIALLNKGVDIQCRDDFGRTALHNAILAKHLSIVEILFNKGADVEVSDDRGDSALHTAVRAGDEAILQFLITQCESDVNATARASITPLHIAAGMDRINICRILIDKGAVIDARDDDNMTPIGHAVEKGARNAVEFMFKTAKAKQFNLDDFLYNADVDGTTLLHMAVDGGVPAIVQLCLEYGAEVRVPKVSDKSTAFHLACAAGSSDVIKVLLEHDPAICRINSLDKDWITPLHRAAKNDNAAIVELLLDQGAKIDPPAKSKKTPLFLAAANGATESVKILLERGADVTVKDYGMTSMLHAAVGSADTIEMLLQKPSAAYLITDKDNRSFTPAHYAARRGRVQDIAHFMSKNKAAAGVTSNTLDTPVHIAAKYGYEEIVEKLLVGRNVRLINLQNNKGMTPLNLACSNGHHKVAKFLLDLGATVDTDQDQMSPLHHAAVVGSKKSIECVLEKHPGCLNAVEENKNTALHLAAREGNFKLVDYFLSLKQQAVLSNSYKWNVLDMAMKNDQEEVAMVIAEHDRWREVLDSSCPGPLAQMQTLVERMPDVAERFLDRCVKKEGDIVKDDYKVIYDFSIVQGQVAIHKNKRGMEDNLIALKAMINKRREKCLTHPILFRLMLMKWKRFGFVVLAINMLLYLMYLLPLTALAMYSREQEPVLCGENKSTPRQDYLNKHVSCTFDDWRVQLTSYLALIFALVHIAREFQEMYHLKKGYFTSLTNMIELSSFSIGCAYILPSCDCKIGFKPQIGAVAMFLGWLNLILYLRRLSFYGQYVIMLATMFVTLFKVLLLFLFFLMAFGTTFYMLSEDQDVYQSLSHSLMTMFVMTLGELNYSDVFMPWKDYQYATSANIFFILFVLGMPIIVMNLLVGLAVGDIDNIQKNAVMDRYVMQIEMLIELEEELPSLVCRSLHTPLSQVEYPNVPKPLRTRFYEAICGFAHPESDEEEEDDEDDDDERENLRPMITQISEKVEEQDVKIDNIFSLLKKQHEMLETLSRNMEEDKEEKAERKQGAMKLYSVFS